MNVVFPSGKQREIRLFSLDILRGLAACLVLFRHMPWRSASTSLGPAGYVVNAIQEIGWCGVDLFFVLSGYLISGLLFKELEREGNLNLYRFWLRRGLKIWPSYFVAYGTLAAVWCVVSYQRNDDTLFHTWLESFLANGLFVQNYVPCLRWPHSWSLAVEEHFYMSLPLLLMVGAIMARRRGSAHPANWCNALLIVGGGLCVATLLGRILSVAMDWNWSQLYYMTHTRADALIFGIMLCCLHRYRSTVVLQIVRFWPVLLMLPVLALGLVMFHTPEQSARTSTVGFTALYLSFGGLVLLAGVYPQFGQNGNWPMVFVTRPLAMIGVYSYTIYLVHSIAYEFPGTDYLRKGVLHLEEGSWADKGLFWSLSIVGGILLSHAVERPLLRWRERLLPNRRHLGMQVEARNTADTSMAAAGAN